MKNIINIKDHIKPEATPDEEFGDFVISGFGKDIRWSAQFYLILAALAVVPMSVGYFLSSRLGLRLVPAYDLIGIPMRARSNLYHVYIGAGIVLAVLFVSYAMISAQQITKTEIFVYEDGIVGLGFTKILAPLMPFFLPYGEIKSVVTEQGMGSALRVVIITQGGRHTVSSPNAAEIYVAINGRLKK